MKILVLGADIGNSLATSLALQLATKKVEVVTVDSIDNIEPDEGDILICKESIENTKKLSVYCGHPLQNVGVNAFPQEVRLPKPDNSFRGGSRKKGGKIGYRRN